MQSNEPLDDDGMNPYLKSVLTGLGNAAIMEVGAQVIHRATKNIDHLDVEKLHNFMGQALYNEKIEQPQAKELLKKMKFSDAKAEKFSHKMADSKVANFLTAGLSTKQGRINAYGLGTLGSLAITAISENNKDDKQ